MFARALPEGEQAAKARGEAMLLYVYTLKVGANGTIMPNTYGTVSYLSNNCALLTAFVKQ